nr:hypothetical protein B0A51_02204 [Rachicladosporium sp. CCFEE 5018]
MAPEPPSIWTTSIPNESPRLVIVCIVFLLLTTAVVSVRFSWRWVHRQRGLDDVMCLCAYTLLLLATIFAGVSAHYGFGKHMRDIQPTSSKAVQFFYLYQICYKLLGMFTKLTFCFLYLRIFNQKWFHRLVKSIASIIVLGSLAFTLATVFTCIPVHKFWNRKIPGRCTNNTAFWFSHAAFNTFFDVVIYILPMPMIRTLKLARGQKLGLISIFSLGAFVIAASIVRMVMLRGSALTRDPTWGSVQALMWTEIEGNTSVIICCLPALRVPFLNAWHRARGAGRRPDTPPQIMRAHHHRDLTWDGRHQSMSEAHHPSAPSRAVQSNVPAQGKASPTSGSGGSKISRSTDSWYRQILHSINRDDMEEAEPITRVLSSDHQPAATAEHQTTNEPNMLEFGMGCIVKTTDVHVSTTQITPRIPGRALTLQEFLGDGKGS